MKCLYCDGTYWREALNGETCIVMLASMENTRCGGELLKGEAGKGHVLHGCRLSYDCNTGLYGWKSNKHSSAYCDTTEEWHSGRVVRIVCKGTCPDGQYCWDIYVSD
jgi:hypothetical protein